MNKELTVQEAALAWAQGKKVEAAWKDDSGRLGRWGALYQFETGAGEYWPVVLRESKGWVFRLAPEPPAKRYRPWTLEELPAMAIFRKTHMFGWFALQGANEGGVWFNTPSWGAEQARFDQLLSDHEHSTDNGKTWLPCGVEVKS